MQIQNFFRLHHLHLQTLVLPTLLCPQTQGCKHAAPSCMTQKLLQAPKHSRKQSQSVARAKVEESAATSPGTEVSRGRGTQDSGEGPVPGLGPSGNRLTAPSVVGCWVLFGWGFSGWLVGWFAFLFCPQTTSTFLNRGAATEQNQSENTALPRLINTCPVGSLGTTSRLHHAGLAVLLKNAARVQGS